MGGLPHARDENPPSEADDEDGWGESSTHEADWCARTAATSLAAGAVFTSESDRTRKHPFYVIWVHGTVSQYIGFKRKQINAISCVYVPPRGVIHLQTKAKAL
jgi:hypothetical protein